MSRRGLLADWKPVLVTARWREGGWALGRDDTEEFEAIPGSGPRSGQRFIHSKPKEGGAERLAQGTLGSFDVASSTMANMAPAMSFYFSFAVIAGTSGLASPLVIILAAVAIAILGNTLAEFSRSTPSAGSFVTFVGMSFGPVAAVTTALTVSAGYVIAIAAVVVISGEWFDAIVLRYLHLSAPWEIYSTVFVLGAAYMMFRGVRVSTKVAASLFATQLAILLIVSVAVLVDHHRALTLQPFNPAKLSGGFSGLSLGFPLAMFMFIGWENSASLAEETVEPRHNVPRAIFASVAIMALTYVFLSYATVVGFGDNMRAVASSSVPFLDAAHGVNGLLLFLAYLAGMASIVGSLVAASNSQSRIIFSSGREGILPSFTARLSATRRTPWASIALFLGIAMAISFAFGGRTDPVVFFGEIATLGTILVALVYLVSNLALPFYYRRHHPEDFNLVRHLVLPALGVLCIGFPLFELVKPGQSAPFSFFPYVALAIVVVSVAYAFYLNRKDPELAERIGSFVADSE